MTAARETHAERLVRIRREHEAAVAKVRREHHERLTQTQRIVEESATEMQLEKKLREERDQLRAELDDDYVLRSRQAWRRHRLMIGLPLDDKQKEEQAIEEIEGNKIHVNEPIVVAFRAWLERICATEGITVFGYLSPAIRNGKAVRKQRRIWSPPVQSLETALIRAHEVGHVLGDTDPQARSTPGEFGIGRVCPSDELAAWRWAMSHAPQWTDTEHAFMGRCLGTYRGAATEPEQQAIDWLTGNGGRREAWLARTRVQDDRTNQWKAERMTNELRTR